MKSYLSYAVCAFAFLSASLSADWSGPVTISTLPGTISAAHPLAIDTNSNAVVGWADGMPAGHNIFSQFLPSGATTWNSPSLIDSDIAPFFLFPPVLDMDKLGNQIAGWAEFQTPFPTSSGTAFRSVRTPSDGSWPAPFTAPVALFPSATSSSTDLLGNSQSIFAEGSVAPFTIVFYTTSDPGFPQTLATNNLAPPVVANFANNGLGVVLYKTDIPTLTLVVNRYIAETNQFIPTSNIPLPMGTTNIMAADIGLDPNGNSVALFIARIGATNEVFTSTMLAGSNTWSTPELISNILNQASKVSISLDASGNAYLLWTEQVTPTREFVRAATLPLDGTPINVTDLTSSTILNSFIDPSFHIVSDSFGNAIAIWGHIIMGTRSIEVAQQPFGGTWSPVTILSSTGRTPSVVLSDQETAVAVWVDTMTNLVMGATNRFPFPLAPPTNFVATLRATNFLLHTEFTFKLTWDPSPAPNIVEYQILRNGTVIATVPGTGPFVFVVCVKPKHLDDVFTIIAVASNGNTSLPITATVVFH